MARTNDSVRYPVEFRVSFILESRITSTQSTPCVGKYEANGHNCENWGNGLYLSLLYIRRFIHRSIESWTLNCEHEHSQENLFHNMKQLAGARVSEWMNERANERVNEWASDQPTDRPTNRPTDRAREQTEEWMSGCWDFCMCVDCKEYCVFPFFSNINGNKKKKNRNNFPALCQSTGDASNVHMCLYKTNTVPCIVHTMTALPNPPAIHISMRACVQLCARQPSVGAFIDSLWLVNVLLQNIYFDLI